MAGDGLASLAGMAHGDSGLEDSAASEVSSRERAIDLDAGADELADLRRRIDDVDAEVVALLNRRARLSVAVGHVKAGRPGASAPVYQPDREAQVYDRVAGLSEGPLSAPALRAIYAEILSSSRALQGPLRVGYLGPIGTFTHEAAMRSFGTAAVYVPCRTIEDVFDAADRGEVDHGVVGVENSTAGAVTPTLDVFLTTRLQICGELELAIAHNLFGHGSLQQVTKVYSHPQALAQCRRWLSEHLPGAEQIETASTSLAVQLAAKSPELAAVGPESAGKLHGLPLLVSSIQDSSSNVTRFLVLGRERCQRTGHDKLAIVFAVKDRPGALRDALDVFAGRGIDMTRIESRPSRQQLWEYVFYADLAGHPDDEMVAEALAELEQQSLFVKVLGAWPVH